MKRVTEWKSTRRTAGLVILTIVLGGMLPSAIVMAAERQYLVMLANSPKHYPGPDREILGQPDTGLVNPELINQQYFDQVNPDIGSFAEYWEEISYGDVTISGTVTDWVELPWAIMPPLADPETDGGGDPSENESNRISPADFFPLREGSQYVYGQSESFDNGMAQVIVDTDGDPLGTDDGPFIPGPGSSDVDRVNGLRAVWMPGERFVDFDSDGRWDGFDETTNTMDWNGDGRPDNPGPWYDLNQDNVASPLCEEIDGETGVYLVDSDNSRRFNPDLDTPDCCPLGPGMPGCEPYPSLGACPASQWTDPFENEIIDCNGNLINDAADIDSGLSADQVPFVPDDASGTCVPGEANGTPDECEYDFDLNDDGLVDPEFISASGLQCRTGEAGDCDVDPCCALPLCVEFGEDNGREPKARCEGMDANRDGQLDFVEPFENFLRRWDPCLIDPDHSGSDKNLHHWVKVYDPNSPNADATIACSAPMYSITYNDPSYIINNYPGNHNAVIAQTTVTTLYGQADPLEVLPDGACVCAIDVDGNVGGPCQDFDIGGDGSIEQDVCIAGFMAVYNPPDSWTNVEYEGGGETNFEGSTKMQAAPGAPGSGQATFATATPQPGDGPAPYNEEQPWYPQAWTDRYQGALGTCECVNEDFDLATYDPATGTDEGGNFPFDGMEADCCEAPVWPMGFDPNGTPGPGGPSDGAAVANTLLMRPFVDSEQAEYDPTVNRRYFKANFGGTNGDGTGLFGEPILRLLAWETGLEDGQNGFEEDNNRAILPEEESANTPGQFFDGWIEYDDLPSSKYHRGGDEFLGEITSPFLTWVTWGGGGDGDPYNAGIGDTEGGRRIPSIWGHDSGDHDPNTPNPGGGGDQLIVAGGPYALHAHGSKGRDGGNVLLLELLTWRTVPPFNNGLAFEFDSEFSRTYHPYAGPGPGGDMMPNANLGFRDYNLDGLVDQGEVRLPGSENYLEDSYPGTPNNGTNTAYPFNRRRIVEDCVAVVDESLDFDDFVDANSLARVECFGGTQIPGAVATTLPFPLLTPDANGFLGLDDFIFPNGLVSGIVLLPDDAHQPNQFPIAPSFYPIHTEDLLTEGDREDMFPPEPAEPFVSWGLFFHDLVISLGVGGEGEANLGTEGFQTAYSAHEYLHSWEGFPDLYDYDVFGPPGPVINCPIGEWDIMAGGGLVHPSPILKEGPCTEWISPVDLTTVLTPGVEAQITLPPYERVRDNSAYFIENENRLGERHYFYSVAGDTTPDNFDMPGFPGFGDDTLINGGMPGPGMLIQHTDVGSNPDGLPLQQGTGTRFTYKFIQADGLGQLEAGSAGGNCGDAGDPWPGTSGATVFNFTTVPPATWYTNNAWTGISITDIVEDGVGSVSLTLSWVPTSIPGIKFIDPPGGVSVPAPPAVIYQVRAEATDVFGGSLIRFFYTQTKCSGSGEVCASDDDCGDGETCDADIVIDPDGANFIGTIEKVNPGTAEVSVDWNIADVPDGRYVVFAELVPAEGGDGAESANTLPRPGRNNVGDGSLTVSNVNVPELRASSPFGFFTGPNIFVAFDSLGNEIDFQAEGVQIGDQLTTGSVINADTLFTDRKPVLRTVEGFTTSIGIPALELSADINPSDGTPAEDNLYFVESWQIFSAGSSARFETWTAEATDGAGTDWTVYSSLSQPVPDEDDPDQDPFPHATTGVPYTSIGNEVTFTINAGTTPFGAGDTFSFSSTGISAESTGVTISLGGISESPTAVIEAVPLSGEAPLVVSFDGRESVDPEGQDLEYTWTFGDGDSASGSVVTHTYESCGVYSAVLRVTNPDGLFDEAAVDINVINNSPNAVVLATPTSGPTPLTVEFDATQSSDTETAAEDLIYEWVFGDGQVAGSGVPGEFRTVTHFYAVDGTYNATLTVTDFCGDVEDRSSTDTVSIMVGNTNPVVNVSYTGLTGTDPWDVTFNAINSFDADGDPLEMTWNWGDGSASQTLPITGTDGLGNVVHTFDLPVGQASIQYLVTGVLTDDRGGQAIWPGVTVTVNEPAPGFSDPRAIFDIEPNPVNVNEEVTVDASLSYDLPAGSTIASYSWDWGDGSPIETFTTPQATHTYTEAGEYNILLTVADAESPPNTHTSGQVVEVLGEDGGVEPPPVVNNPPVPVINATPKTGVAGVQVFTFDASGSTDPDEGHAEALTYSWTFDDGGTASGEVVTHIFQSPGTYLVRLTVTDPLNGSATATQIITVTGSIGNVAPVAIIASGIRTGTAPVSLTFNGSASYDLDNDPLTYTWDVSLNGSTVATLDGSIVTYLFANPGTYSVTLEVSDISGNSDTAGPIFVTIAARGDVPGIDNDNVEPTPGQDVPDSAIQRPGGALCGFGMIGSLVGTLIGLTGMMASRRRFTW